MPQLDKGVNFGKKTKCDSFKLYIKICQAAYFYTSNRQLKYNYRLPKQVFGETQHIDNSPTVYFVPNQNS